MARYAAGEFQGTLSAYILFFDCADFTLLSVKLLQEGKEGAEELTGLLNAMLSAPIGIVRRYGGFVSLFAGDAFCAIFPDAGDGRVLAAASGISRHFAEQPTYQGSLGSYDLKARQTVCYGDLAWEIFVNAWQNEYVFSGEPLRELADLSGLKAEIIFSESAARRLGREHFSQLERGYCPFGPAPELPECPLRNDFPPETDIAFRNARYANEQPQNEIRTGAFCFASLEAIPPAGRGAAIAALERLADIYGGYLNKLDATDKGLTAIILFGLPRSQGKTLEQICRFSLEASAELPQLALGISCGSVYAGYTGGGGSREYTALGYPPNLASRLMSKARPGEILTDASFWQEYYRSYPFAYLGVLNLKGIAQPLRYYRLEQKSGITLPRQESRFTGRDEELRALREMLDSHLKERNNALIRVCGEPGIGKSRLASEALSALDQGGPRIFRISCDALLRPPLEAFKQILRNYFYYNPLLPAEAGTAMFRGLWAALAGQDPELLRIESCIAHLLGYGWENSVWSLLPAAEKPHQLRDALARFLARLAQDKPVVLFLDDAQWLDEESLDLLRQFSAEGIGPLLILVACRYSEDGSVPELTLPGHATHDLDLGNLGPAGCADLIASILRLPGVPDATAELIGSRAMGNPLFVEQLTAYLQESGSLNDKGALTTEVGYLSSFGISDIVGARIDRLTESVRESVTSASVLGAEFNVSVLARMLNREELPELADAAKSRIWKALDELRYIFTHILIRDTIYQRTVSAKLRQLHQLAAEALEAIHHGDLPPVAEEIARHCLLAGLEGKAADYLSGAAGHYLEEALFNKAEQCAAQAFRIRQEAYGAEDSRSVAALALLAKIRYGQGRYPEAEELYQQVVQLREQRLGSDHPDTLRALCDLASLHVDQGRYDTTEPVLRRIIDKRTELLGREHPDTAMAMVNLATCYTQQGKFDQAGPLAKEALDTLSRVHGREHADTLSALNNLANLHIYKGEWEPAEQLLLEALPLWEKLRGQDHPDLAMSLNNLANVYLNQKRYELAEPLYQRVVRIYERILGTRHPHTAISWFNLAGVYAGVDRYAEAEPLFLRALEVWRSSLGDAHPYTVMAIRTLSDLYREMGDPAKSDRYQAMLPAEQDPAPA